MHNMDVGPSFSQKCANDIYKREECQLLPDVYVDDDSNARSFAPTSLPALTRRTNVAIAREVGAIGATYNKVHVGPHPHRCWYSERLMSSLLDINRITE